MRRRDFIAALGGAAAGYALALLTCGPSIASNPCMLTVKHQC